MFGHKFINTRLVADAYAARGHHVFIPDVLGGTAMDPAALGSALDEPPSTSTLTWLANGCRMFGAVLSSGAISWIMAHGPAVTSPRVEKALAAVRARASALGAHRLGAIGFCFGAPYALQAAARGNIDAYAVAHPSNVAVPGDVAPLVGKVRGLFCLAETDAVFPKSAVAATEALLAGKGAEFITYAGQAHGFAVRGGAHSLAAREKCMEDVAAFFSEALGGRGKEPTSTSA